MSEYFKRMIKKVSSGLATIGVVGAGIGIGLIFAGVVVAVSRNGGIERETRSRFRCKSFYDFTEVSEIIGGFTKYNEFIRSIFRKIKLSKSNFYKIFVVKVLFLIYLVKLAIIRLSIMLNLSMEVSSNKFEGKYGQSNERGIEHKEGRSLSRDMNKGERIARVNGNIDVNVKEQKIIKINLVRNRSIRTAGLRGDRGITRSYRRINRRYRYSSSNTIVQLINDLDIGVVALIFVVSLVSIKVINKNTAETALKQELQFEQEREKIKSVFQESIQDVLKDGQIENQNKVGGREIIKDIAGQVKEIKESTDATIQLVGDTYKESVTESTIAYQDTIGTSLTEIKYIIGILAIISLIMVYRKVILELIRKRK